MSVSSNNIRLLFTESFNIMFNRPHPYVTCTQSFYLSTQLFCGVVWSVWILCVFSFPKFQNAIFIRAQSDTNVISGACKSVESCEGAVTPCRHGLQITFRFSTTLFDSGKVPSNHANATVCIVYSLYFYFYLIFWLITLRNINCNCCWPRVYTN